MYNVSANDMYNVITIDMYNVITNDICVSPPPINY